MDFEGFSGREKSLLNVARFGMYPVMHYRTNLFIHEKRVHSILSEILPIAKKVFGDALDAEKALALALVHDDAEIITGDIQLGHKLKMTEEQLAKIDDDEAKAIEELSKKWPEKAMGYSYRALLYNALRKDCLEAEIVSFADKTDAYCESLHELFSGNRGFVSAVEIYIKVLGEFTTKFPRISKLLAEEHPFLEPPRQIDFEAVLKKGKPYDMESVSNSTGIPNYEVWKKITIRDFGVEPLINVIEKM